MEIKDYLYIAGALVGVLAAIFSDRWQNKQNKDDIKELKENTVSANEYNKNLEVIKETNNSQWKRIDEILKWQVTHEKEAWDHRNRIELKIAMVHGENEKLSTKLDNIEKKLDDLIERLVK